MAWAAEGAIDAEGISLAYLETGEGSELPAIVLIHGAGGDRNSWRLLLRHFAGCGLHGVALELPGHGKSPCTGKTPDIQGYARVVEAFIGARGLSSPILAGHSMGGAIALTLGLEVPGKLAGLVLIGTGARLRVNEEILHGLRSDYENTVSRITGYAYSKSAAPGLVAEGKRQFLECAPEVLRGDFKACGEFNVMDRIGQIDLPALVVCGKDDTLTPPKYSEFLAEKIPSARLHIVERSGHMVMAEQPRLVGEAIREFAGTLQA